LVGKAKQDTGTGPSCSSFQVKVLRLFYETRKTPTFLTRLSAHCEVVAEIDRQKAQQ
jgi:hypothetical protein